MSTPKGHPIQNAMGIIEKFGGIRPMAAKIDVAVTTIQGWKKRGTIPAVRKAVILLAAQAHAIDVSEFFEDAPVTEEKAPPSMPVSTSQDEFRAPRRPLQDAPSRAFTRDAIEQEKKATTKTMLMAAAVTFVILLLSLLVLLPFLKDTPGRDDVRALEKQTGASAFKGLVPENWSAQLSTLKQQVAQQAGQVASNTLETMQDASWKLIDNEGLESRARQLQSYVSEIANEGGIYGLLSYFESMENSVYGQQTLDSAVVELSALLDSMKGKDDAYVNGALDAARAESSVLQETFGNLPQQDLKASALLLALTQVRAALNRSDEAFDGDLALLLNMVDEDDLALRASLEKLAPHSKSGVLSAGGLQSEFRTIAGEVVAASLRGEDVSFSEKASARVNEILQTEKSAALVTGTPTQVTVQNANHLLQGENFDAALQHLKRNLRAKELKPLRPWIKKVEAMLTAQKTKRLIEKAIEMQAGSGFLGGQQLLNAEE